MTFVTAHIQCNGCGAATSNPIRLVIPAGLEGFDLVFDKEYHVCSLACLEERATYWRRLEREGRLS